MNTVIAYSSKHGTTAEIARLIAARINGKSHLCDLASGPPDLSAFSTVVLGTAIYVGQARPEMKSFCRTENLSGKRLGLFVCGMEKDSNKQSEELSGAFPKNLQEQAVVRAFLPGRFRFATMSMTERFIIRRIAKTGHDVDAIDPDAITAFTTQLVGSE